MSITIEAIYESGVLKPLTPLPHIKEREKVRLTVEPISVIDDQRKSRLQIDPDVAREIIDSHEHGLLES
jgi:predicted DNA-binding antitoxin AbrB/MazE fold protein